MSITKLTESLSIIYQASTHPKNQLTHFYEVGKTGLKFAKILNVLLQ